MAKIKLKDWATKQGLSYITANRHFHLGLIPNAEQLSSGSIMVEEEDVMQQTQQNNDAMSLFLKKTVEFSKNNATVEDFAAYVISNFSLKLSGSDSPRYSRQKPKSEEVQKHFQQFLPKGEKPKPHAFVMEPDTLEDLQEVSKPVNSEELVQEFKQAIQTPEPSASVFSNPGVVLGNELTSAEGTVTRNVDLSTPQQQINYTGSNNSTLSTFSSSVPVDNAHVGALLNNTAMHVGVTNSLSATGMVDNTVSGGLYFVGNNSTWEDPSPLVGAFQPTQRELRSSKTVDTQSLPKRRGRKPITKR